MNYFHINIENREQAMPLIFKPLGLEVLLVFLFFFFFLSLFSLIFVSFCFPYDFVLVFLKQVFKV